MYAYGHIRRQYALFVRMQSNAYIHTYVHTDRQTDRQTHTDKHKQTNRQTDLQYRHTYVRTTRTHAIHVVHGYCIVSISMMQMHACWDGLFAGVVLQRVAKMIEPLTPRMHKTDNSRKSDIITFVGPDRGILRYRMAHW